MRKAIFTFGRFNPPTIGHKALLDKVEHHAHKHDGDHYVFASKSHDNKKNPLQFTEKMDYLNVMFPNINFKNEKSVNNPFEAIHWLVTEGYTDVTMIVGSDRAEEFERAIRPYINHQDPTKNLKLETFQIVSAGERDPDSDGIVGASSSKARQLVQDGKYDEFKQIIPIPDDLVVRTMFSKIGLGLQPEKPLSEAEKIRKLIDAYELGSDDLKETLDFVEDATKVDVRHHLDRYKIFMNKVLEAKDPYQVLKQFDKKRAARGKEPIFKKEPKWKVEKLDSSTHDWIDTGKHFNSKDEAKAWIDKQSDGRYDIAMS